MNLDAALDLKKVVISENVASLLSREDCSKIAHEVLETYQMDLSSRAEWEERMKTALNLALQVAETKTFPWPNSANVKFPLITVAALQFHARAYSAMIPGPDIVKCQTFGEDPDGSKSARATRVSGHMSYQILEEDENWEDNHDRVLITVPIIGCAFKKSYFDSFLGHNVSENVLAKDLVIPYFAKSLEQASRLTHRLEVSENYILTRERKGLFCAPPSDQPAQYNGFSSELDRAASVAQGISPAYNDPNTPRELLEQHRWLDLDGDGFAEPYIVTVRKDTAHLCRIVARFHSSGVKRNSTGEVYHIDAINYFTKYPFIPSPDGGIYDLGFGILLGPLNESINTLINQLLDAGTLSTTAGGFLGRGAKLRSGETSFKPFEWKRVDSTGDDLRKNIVPLDTKPPSQVLFALLQLLINYGERVGGATDPQVGVNPGQNTPAETSRNMIAEGQKVFIGIFKRLHRAMKSEFRKLYLLNQLHLDDVTTFYPAAASIPSKVLREDYIPSEKSICPAADPNMVSDAQKIQQAQFLREASATTAGYDRGAVERRFLRALQITDIETIYPGPDKVPAPVPIQLQVAQLKAQTQAAHDQSTMKMAAYELMGEVELNQAKIQELRASAAKLLAEAQGAESGHAIALLNAQIGAAKAHQDGLLRSAKIILDGIKMKQEMGNGSTSEGSANLGGVQQLVDTSSYGGGPSLPGGTGGAGAGGLG